MNGEKSQPSIKAHIPVLVWFSSTPVRLLNSLTPEPAACKLWALTSLGHYFQALMRKSTGEYGHSIPVGYHHGSVPLPALGNGGSEEISGCLSSRRGNPFGNLEEDCHPQLHPPPLGLWLSQSLLWGDPYLFLCSGSFGAIVPVDILTWSRIMLFLCLWENDIFLVQCWGD